LTVHRYLVAMELPGSNPDPGAADRPKAAAERPPVVMASVKFCSLAKGPSHVVCVFAAV
jgi:hypothetical protein